MGVHDTAQLVDSTVGDAELREFVTVHDSEIGDDSRLYERVSVKKSAVGESVDINAGAYVENARLDDRVQIGPNAVVAGVTHELTDRGMTHREDRFERVVVEVGAFVGAGAVVLPGVRVGENAVVAANATVAEDVPAGTLVRPGAESVRESLDGR